MTGGPAPGAPGRRQPDAAGTVFTPQSSPARSQPPTGDRFFGHNSSVRRLLLVSFLASALAVAAPGRSWAQQSTDPAANAKVHIGPLALTPSVSLTNLGIDTNVFNTVDNPQRDFTVTLKPETLAWLHLGRGLLTANIGGGIVYFKKFASQRSIDTDDTVRLDLPLNRLRPYAIEAYKNARERPNAEIDARARYTTNSTTAGLDLRIFGQTSIGAYGRYDRVRYDQNELFFGTNLAQSLNRHTTAAGVTLSEQLTPFTTVTLTGEASQDRFKFDTEKNSDSVRGLLGIALNPAALISGKATIGYRKFDALGGGVPGFKGLTATADLNYVLLGRTRFGLQVQRDVDYSFDIITPYYVLTAVNASVAQQLFGPVDLTVRGGRQSLAYRGIAGDVQQAANRTDLVYSYGGGIGYRIGDDLRVGFNVDQYRRTSSVDIRQVRGPSIRDVPGVRGNPMMRPSGPCRRRGCERIKDLLSCPALLLVQPPH